MVNPQSLKAMLRLFLCFVLFSVICSGTHKSATCTKKMCASNSVQLCCTTDKLSACCKGYKPQPKASEDILFLEKEHEHVSCEFDCKRLRKGAEPLCSCAKQQRAIVQHQMLMESGSCVTLSDLSLSSPVNQVRYFTSLLNSCRKQGCNCTTAYVNQVTYVEHDSE